MATDQKSSPITAAAVTIPVQVYAPCEWPFRLAGNLFLLTVIFMLASAIMTVKSNFIGRKLSDFLNEFYTYSSTIGFQIDDIIIRGREKTSKEDIIKKIPLTRKDNILNIELSALQKQLEQLPWIRKVSIRRTYLPNLLQIDIQEREVKSLWQIDHKFYPIDSDGHVIKAPYQPDHPLLLIVGAGAPQNITFLMKIISENPEIYKRIKVANFISQRRWNIVLDDIEQGITIKLPEKNIERAWKKLLKLQTTQGILKRKLTIIDLRFPNKTIVKLGKMTPQERHRLKGVKESRI